jgi:O-antigen/teichoic acid export membrane protein
LNTQRESGGVRNRLIKGIKWTALQSVVVAASNFATAVLAARLLGLDTFGAYSIIRITGFTMATMAGAGLGVTATKYIAEMRGLDNVRLSRISDCVR